jgi:alpha-1,2-mannosyltransferase
MGQHGGATRRARVHPRWWLPVAVLVAAAAFVSHDRLLGFETYFGLFGNGVDAEVYRYGGGTVRTAEALYTFVLYDALPFTYPPFAALTFVPLSVLSLTGTHFAVTLANLVLVYLAVSLCWRRLGYGDTTRVRLISICLAAAFTWIEPVRMTI